MYPKNELHIDVQLHGYLHIEARVFYRNEELLQLKGQIHHRYVNVSMISHSPVAQNNTMQVLLDAIQRECEKIGISIDYLISIPSWYDGAKEHLDLRSLGFHHNKAVEDELGLCDVLIYGDSR